MKPVVGAVASVGVGYLVGSLPSADIVTRLASRGKVDIRKAGTGNPGAANVAEVLGKRWGAVVMALDLAKGFAAARLGARIAGGPGLHAGGPASVAGHCFPAWSGFEGGKGVATSGGQVLATFPMYLPVDAAVAATTARLARNNQAFIATETASLTWTLFCLVWWRKRLPNPGGCAPSVGLPLAALATSAIVRYRFLQTNHQVEEWRNARNGDAVALEAESQEL